MIKLTNILEDVNLDDISKSKSFKDLPSGLKLISSRGTTRNVYEYNNKYVLKIAKNNKGIEQNKKEIENLTKYDSPLFPELKKYDEKNYRYVVIEKVNDFKKHMQFYEFVYPDIDILYKKIRNFYYKQLSEKGYNTSDIYDIAYNPKWSIYFDIVRHWYYDEDIQYKNKETGEIMFTITTEELENILGNNQNARDLKNIIREKRFGKDLHWKNFGYVGNQLKIIDLGV